MLVRQSAARSERWSKQPAPPSRYFDESIFLCANKTVQKIAEGPIAGHAFVLHCRGQQRVRACRCSAACAMFPSSLLMTTLAARSLPFLTRSSKKKPFAGSTGRGLLAGFLRSRQRPEVLAQRSLTDQGTAITVMSGLLPREHAKADSFFKHLDLESRISHGTRTPSTRKIRV